RGSGGPLTRHHKLCFSGIFFHALFIITTGLSPSRVPRGHGDQLNGCRVEPQPYLCGAYPVP
ncbi:MAG: hypothetical protein V3T78_06165, partial [Dehalococcoidia bacterium]